MKFTVASTALVATISGVAESLSDSAERSFHDAVEDTARAEHRNLADAMESQRKLTESFRERRLSSGTKGRLANKIRETFKNSELRNKATEDAGRSNADDAFDLGVFSRKLQANATALVEEEKHFLDDFLGLCGEEKIDGLTCLCSNVNRTSYQLDMFCSYDQNFVYIEEDGCSNNQTVSFTKTMDVSTEALRTGTFKTCYDVVTPVSMSYCFELIYDGIYTGPSSCARSFDGVECNSCSYNRFCSTFDCSNIDIPFLDLGNVGTGTTCGNETIWKAVMDEYMLYGPLPCENGCNLCPGNGFMKDIYNSVTFSPYGVEQEYYCYSLNTAALVGYLQEVPGNLCETLPPLVTETCGCSEEVSVGSGVGDVTVPTSSQSKSSATISSASGGLAIAAAAGSIFSWMMV